MSDYYSDPHIETQAETLPPPESYSGTPGESPGTKEAIESIQEEIFDKIANSDDDATDYVEERRDRDADERGEKLSPERERARLERYQKALEAAGDEATHDAHEHLTSEQDHNFELQRRDNAVRAIAKHEMRVEAFERQAPDYKDTIKSVFSVLPLAEHVAEAILQSEIGPEIAYKLAQNFDQIDAINAMSPDQIRLDIARAEGMRAAQNTQQQQPARRATRAPAPLRSLKGGASPSFDASTASMDEYVARRKAGWKG